MAGDWIKMRVNLVTHPKVMAIAEHLAGDSEYQDWSNLAGFGVSLGGTEEEARDEFHAALRVTRYVTVCALLRFWGYANEHAKGEFIRFMRVNDIDEIVQVPGFGEALQSVGWIAEDLKNKGLSLPNFNEFNAVAGERKDNTAAAKQKRYRDKKRSETSQGDVTEDVTRDVTRDVTSDDREEKRREEEKDTVSASRPSSRKGRATSLPADFGISDRVREWASENRHDRLEQHLSRFVGYAKANGKTYVDWDQAFMNAVRDNWAKLPAVNGHSGGDQFRGVK